VLDVGAQTADRGGAATESQNAGLLDLDSARRIVSLFESPEDVAHCGGVSLFWRLAASDALLWSRVVPG
jgi:hypothetical protein